MPTVENDGLTRIFHNGIILIVLCLRVVLKLCRVIFVLFSDVLL